MGNEQSSYNGAAASAEARQRALMEHPSLELLLIREIPDERVLRDPGWSTTAGLPFYVEHRDIGLVQLVAKHESGGAAHIVRYAVRRLNPVSSSGPYDGGLYEVPAVAPYVHALPLAIVDFKPCCRDSGGGGAGSGGIASEALGAGSENGSVRVLSQRGIVYQVPWPRFQAATTLHPNDPAFESKLRRLNIEFLQSKKDVQALQDAVRLLERCWPLETRAWTAVVPSEREVWSGENSLVPPAATAMVGVRQPPALGGTVVATN